MRSGDNRQSARLYDHNPFTSLRSVCLELCPRRARRAILKAAADHCSGFIFLRRTCYANAHAEQLGVMLDCAVCSDRGGEK
jgi:hypothetical protein